MSEDRELELRTLAKHMVWLQSDYEKSKHGWDSEMVKEEMEQIRQQVLARGYSVDLFVQYMEEYKNMTVEEYRKVYKKNEQS